MKNTIIFYNGEIFTSNPEQPYANAMVVQEGKVSWIGDEKDLEAIEGERVNLKGRRVLPGFIDSHMHPLALANTLDQVPCTPPLVNSIEDLVREIKKKIELHGNDNWIESWGYDEGKLAEGRAPNRWDLDKASTNAPIAITRSCGHIISVNSKALELAGIDRNTKNPAGGEIEKDENGEPTGILKEPSALDLVAKIMPKKTVDDDTNDLANLSPLLFSHGITTICDVSARTEPIDYLDLYGKARAKGLKQRVALYYMWSDLEKQNYIDKTKVRTEDPVTIAGIKIIGDGSVSGRTAWVNPSYLGDDENYGLQITSMEELLAAAEFGKKNNLQLAVHAMGEQTINLVVNTFCNKPGWLDDMPSVRIDHAAMPEAEAVEKAAKAKIAFDTQPIFSYAEIESYLKNLGEKRTKRTYPVKTALDTGVMVVFSSDAPATSWSDPSNPFVAIKSAVTRIAYDGTDIGQDQRIDVHTAIMLYTKEAQKITGIPNIGQLAPGYNADFMVLNKDILDIPLEEIDEVNAEETYMDGKLVYKK